MSINTELSPADQAEITNLYGRYNLSSDAGEADIYADCFTPDGTLQGLRLTQGRETLRAYKITEKAARNHLYRQHWNGSLCLERIDDETVRGRCYFMAFNGTPGEVPAMTHCGSYEDVIVKFEDRWRFKSRRIQYNFAAK
jgi:SnoaL-like protein